MLLYFLFHRSHCGVGIILKMSSLKPNFCSECKLLNSTANAFTTKTILRVFVAFVLPLCAHNLTPCCAVVVWEVFSLGRLSRGTVSKILDWNRNFSVFGAMFHDLPFQETKRRERRVSRPPILALLSRDARCYGKAEPAWTSSQ
jgi:hypothetical protein